MIEFRHIFGCVFDSKGDNISFTDEIKIFHDCLEKAQEVEPNFCCRIISCGLKIIGDDHITSQLQCCIDGQKDTHLIAGFDLVCEEDVTPPLKQYRKMIKSAQEKVERPLNVYLHAGESASRLNENLYDAVMLGSKRIGHGFAILNHPYLIDLVKEKDICLEICPISNLILGYTFDLRWHPARALMHKGVPLTINADDPGFWKVYGVSLDFCYVALAWELTLKELKQFGLNAIKYSSITDSEKEKVTIYFMCTL